MWYWIALGLSAFSGGFVQTVTGFGSSILMMCVLPYFMPVLEASALACAINVALVVASAVRFRKQLSLKLCLLPGALYLGAYYLTLQFVQQLKIDAVEIAFGIFLLLLSLYYLLLAKKASMKDTLTNCFLCAVPSGIMAAVFGIGGPLMALLFLARTKDRRTYIGNLHAVFAVSSIMGTVTRFAKGIYTVQLLPATAVGFAAVLLGNALGNRVGDRMSPEKLKFWVYLFIGVSGLVTLFT